MIAKAADKVDLALTAVFQACDEGGFAVSIKEISGVNSQGDTIEEATDNLLDALKEVLAWRAEKMLKRKKSLSGRRRFEAQLA